MFCRKCLNVSYRQIYRPTFPLSKLFLPKVTSFSNFRNLNYDNQFKGLLLNKLNNLRLFKYDKYFSTLTNSHENTTQQFYIDNEENRETVKLYPSPKNILHNIFDLVSAETKNKSLKVSPHFKLVQDKRASQWICTYSLNWPVEIKFLAKDPKKKFASHKAALAALTWLRKQNKITQSGAPIIYDRQEIKKLTKEKIDTITISKDCIENVGNIINIYNKKMKDHIMNCKEVRVNISNNKLCIDSDHDLDIKSINKKVFNNQRYMAKENVALPITIYKEHFIDLLQNNQVIVVKGEPGCGKSTRIPQYVLESWARSDLPQGKPGMIAVTQPRRIAAISLANRVSNERNERCGSIVGYQVRLNANFTPSTGRILYCTTGILLRQLQSDSNLSNFSHIILDEAHERDVNTDLLMNLLKITLKNNPDLKLIIMSATIDTDKFRKYYNDAPVIEIPGFTYPVNRYYIDSIDDLDLRKTVNMCEGDTPQLIHYDVSQIIHHIHKNKPEGAILCFLPGWDDITKVRKLIPFRNDMAVYCLHSRLEDSEQYKIFSKPPPGVRKVILATNIAETSITIDDVVYVVDTGIHKEQRFDTEKGIKCIDNHWISKASATQRSGRAGRVQPGECYHLYTQSKFVSFQDYSLPEIMRTSLTKIILDSKAFSNNMDTFEFMNNLLTPPETNAISTALNELKNLDLLDENENLTTLGRTLAEFQLEPKLSKALVNSCVFQCCTPIVDIVTLFSTDAELFSSGLIDKEVVKEIKSHFCTNSDHLAMMRLLEKYLDLVEDYDADSYHVKKFCDEYNLIPHKMRTLLKLRKIHSDYLTDGLYHEVLPISDKFSNEDEFVKAVLYSAIGNILHYRNWDVVKNRLKNTNVLITRNNHKATITSESVNYKRNQFPSNYLLYINETRSNIRRTTLIRECSFITNLAVLLFTNKELLISKINDVDLSETHVLIRIDGTNVKFMCKKEDAEIIIECKKVIKDCYEYFITQLTNIGQPNKELNESWCDILENLNTIVSSNKSD